MCNTEVIYIPIPNSETTFTTQHKQNTRAKTVAQHNAKYNNKKCEQTKN